MEHVEWEANGTKYRAVKVALPLSKALTIDDEATQLLKENFWPTKIVGNLATITELRSNTVHRLINHNELQISWAMPPVPLEIDRRVSGFLYILYAGIPEGKLEASEFAGLDELP